MNDPHVRAIHYFIAHDDSVDYKDAVPLVYEDQLFCVRADQGEVIVEPKSHYATEEEAKSALGGFVRRWEFEAALRAGSGKFKLAYARVDITDRSPPPTPAGVVASPATFHFRAPETQVRVTKALAGYPAPPSPGPGHRSWRPRRVVHAVPSRSLSPGKRTASKRGLLLPHSAGRFGPSCRRSHGEQTDTGSKPLPDRKGGARQGRQALVAKGWSSSSKSRGAQH